MIASATELTGCDANDDAPLRSSIATFRKFDSTSNSNDLYRAAPESFTIRRQSVSLIVI